MKRELFKCLYNIDGNTKVVTKSGPVVEILVDCKPVKIGFYCDFRKKKIRYVSVDIQTGLAIVNGSNDADQCLAETEAILMKKGYKHYKACRKKAKQVYQKIYESEEWLNGKGNSKDSKSVKG